MAIPPILVLIGRRQLPPEDFVVLDQSEPGTSLDYAINNNGGRAPSAVTDSDWLKGTLFGGMCPF